MLRDRQQLHMGESHLDQVGDDLLDHKIPKRAAIGWRLLQP